MLSRKELPPMLKEFQSELENLGILVRSIHHSVKGTERVKVGEISALFLHFYGWKRDQTNNCICPRQLLSFSRDSLKPLSQYTHEIRKREEGLSFSFGVPPYIHFPNFHSISHTRWSPKHN